MIHSTRPDRAGGRFYSADASVEDERCRRLEALGDADRAHRARALPETAQADAYPPALRQTELAVL